MRTPSRQTIETTASPVPIAAGTVIAGRYEVLETVERPAGYARYAARHTALGSDILLTELPADIVRQPRHLARVEAAVAGGARLRHDHILPVLDLVGDGDRHFVVESFDAAVRLDHAIADGVLVAPHALHVARQLADALAYAHECGVVHGALHPANVLIEVGHPPRARLHGFALAALAVDGGPVPDDLLAYTAPERLAGQAVDVGTDVFALGQLLFELFEGRPFLSGSASEIAAFLREGTGPLVPAFSGIVPAGVSSLVRRAIRRNPGQRYQRMVHIRADLDACLRSVAQRPTAAAAPAAASAAPVPATAESPKPEAAAAASRVEPPAPAAPAEPVETRAKVVRRAPSPRRKRREPTLSPSILIRVSKPRRTPLAAKLLLGGVVIALGWPLVPCGTPAPPPPRPVPRIEAPATDPIPVAIAPPTRPPSVSPARPTTPEAREPLRQTALGLPARPGRIPPGRTKGNPKHATRRHPRR